MTATIATDLGLVVSSNSTASFENSAMQIIMSDQRLNGKSIISPSLYFKYVKKKFKVLERRVIDKQLKKIEKAFYAAVENGQDVLSEKFARRVAIEICHSTLLAKGIKYVIDKKDLNKFKRKIKGEGHISDTPYKSYTRIIPKSVVKSKKKVESLFDDFIIYHYWNPDCEKDKKEEMSKEEKEHMKDPVLFGVLNINKDQLYYIDEWEDEYCDLSFKEIINYLGKTKSSLKIKKTPQLPTGK